MSSAERLAAAISGPDTGTSTTDPVDRVAGLLRSSLPAEPSRDQVAEALALHGWDHVRPGAVRRALRTPRTAAPAEGSTDAPVSSAAALAASLAPAEEEPEDEPEVPDRSRGHVTTGDRGDAGLSATPPRVSSAERLVKEQMEW